MGEVRSFFPQAPCNASTTSTHVQTSIGQLFSQLNRVGCNSSRSFLMLLRQLVRSVMWCEVNHSSPGLSSLLLCASRWSERAIMKSVKAFPMWGCAFVQPIELTFNRMIILLHISYIPIPLRFNHCGPDVPTGIYMVSELCVCLFPF